MDDPSAKTRSYTRRDALIGLVVASVVVVLPLAVFGAVRLNNYLGRIDLDVLKIEYLCFVERQVGKTRIETQIDWLPCSGARTAVENAKQPGSPPIKYVDGGRGARVTLVVPFDDGQDERQLFVKGAALKQAIEKNKISIVRPGFRHQEVTVVEDWTYLVYPLILVWQVFLPQFAGIVIVLVATIVIVGAWSALKSRLPGSVK